MFVRSPYAPRNYSINYDSTFTVCCPRSEFRNPDNIPVEFEAVPRVQDVFRVSIPGDAAADKCDKFQESLQALKHADEIQAEFHAYRQNLGQAIPVKKF